MTNKPQSNSNAAQRSRLLQYLNQYGSITTLQARQILAVMSPAPRIKELRESGYSITTNWVIDIDSAGIEHRQGLYVLSTTEKENAQP